MNEPLDMIQFAKEIVHAYTSNPNGGIQLMPMTERDMKRGCILRFRIGTAK